jgi:hypothetical protein
VPPPAADGRAAAAACRCAAALQAGLAPLRALLQQWRVHEPLLRLDVGQYVSALEARGEELALADVGREIGRQREELAAMEAALAPAATLGIAQVSCAKVRG